MKNKRHSLFLVIPGVIEALCQELGTKTRYILSCLNACVMYIDIIYLVLAEPDTVSSLNVVDRFLEMPTYSKTADNVTSFIID